MGGGGGGGHGRACHAEAAHRSASGALGTLRLSSSLSSSSLSFSPPQQQQQQQVLLSIFFSEPFISSNYLLISFQIQFFFSLVFLLLSCLGIPIFLQFCVGLFSFLCHLDDACFVRLYRFTSLCLHCVM